MSIKITNNIPKFLKITKGKIRKGLIQGSQMLTTNIRKNTKVDTGRLRSSVEETGRVEEGGNSYKTKVETPVEYAVHQEYGTYKMAPRAMFRKGADQSRNSITNILIKNLKA